MNLSMDCVERNLKLVICLKYFGPLVALHYI